jgi:hypothetical protein
MTLDRLLMSLSTLYFFLLFFGFFMVCLILLFFIVDRLLMLIGLRCFIIELIWFFHNASIAILRVAC